MMAKRYFSPLRATLLGGLVGLTGAAPLMGQGVAGSAYGAGEPGAVAWSAERPAVRPAEGAIVSPVERPVDRALMELTRAALREPATVQAWTGLARTLRGLRPAGAAAVPTAAEEAAWAALDAVASATPGAVREVRVTPSGPHTEIAVRTSGAVRHRLFQRLGDPRDPRLTMVLTGASNAIVEDSFNGIERGGVRAIRVSEFGADTVQVAVHLQASSAFTIFRRDDDLILRIENPDGDFVPWTSRPELVGKNTLAGSTEGGAATDGTALIGYSAGVDASAADADAATAAAASDMATDAASNAASTTAAAATDAAPASNSPLRQRLEQTRDLAGALLAGAGRAASDHGHLLFLGALTLALMLPLASSRVRRQLRFRVLTGIRGQWRGWRDARAVRKAERSRNTGRSRKTAHAQHAVLDTGLGPQALNAPKGGGTAPRHQTASRIWAARTLAAHGASADEIVQKTGLARDAVLLLAPALQEREQPEESAASGTFFPRARGADAGALDGGAALRH